MLAWYSLFLQVLGEFEFWGPKMPTKKHQHKTRPFYPSLSFWEGGDLASLLTTSEGAKARKQGLAFV